jgi:hypothetical protein
MSDEEMPIDEIKPRKKKQAKNASTRLTIPFASAATELGVTRDTVWKWVVAGHLPIFIPPGDSGPGCFFGYQVFLKHWEAFKARQIFVNGVPTIPPLPRSDFLHEINRGEQDV